MKTLRIQNPTGRIALISADCLQARYNSTDPRPGYVLLSWDGRRRVLRSHRRGDTLEKVRDMGLPLEW